MLGSRWKGDGDVSALGRGCLLCSGSVEYITDARLTTDLELVRTRGI